METVEVVIKIPKEDMETINDPKGKGRMQDNMESYRKMIQIADRVFLAVENGTVLPKGHGRLVDAGEIAREVNRAWTLWEKKGEDCYLFVDVLTPLLVSQPTVIEADKAESEE